MDAIDYNERKILWMDLLWQVVQTGIFNILT